MWPDWKQPTHQCDGRVTAVTIKRFVGGGLALAMDSRSYTIDGVAGHRTAPVNEEQAPVDRHEDIVE